MLQLRAMLASQAHARGSATRPYRISPVIARVPSEVVLRPDPHWGRMLQVATAGDGPARMSTLGHWPRMRLGPALPGVGVGCQAVRTSVGISSMQAETAAIEVNPLHGGGSYGTAFLYKDLAELLQNDHELRFEQPLSALKPSIMNRPVR